MKTAIVNAIMFLTVELFVAQKAFAQGTVSVSNLGEPPTGSMVVGSDSWIAQVFGTGINPGGYRLNSIQLLMDAASGSPNGFTVSIYSDAGNAVPGNSLGSLSGVDPAAGGLFTYTGSDIMLSPDSFYSVVVSGATPVAQGAYNWSAASGITYVGDQLGIAGFYYSSGNGSSWTFHPRQYAFQLGINGTAVPEPSSVVLLLLGGGAFALFRRGESKAEHIKGP